MCNLKKRICYLVIVALVLSMAVGNALGADISEYSSGCAVKICLKDNAEKPVENADVWLYGYNGDKEVLIQSGRTNDKGELTLYATTKGLSMDSENTYYDYTVHAADPLYGVVSESWSVKANDLSSKTTISAKEVCLAFGSIQLPQGKYTGSGIYRTTKVDTVECTDDTTIGVMFHDRFNTGFTVKATYMSGVANQLQVKKQFLFPSVGSWSVSGSRTRDTAASYTETWENSAIGTIYDGMELDTEFVYDQEVWEYQEQDGDIDTLWHTVQRWVEVKVDRHAGGKINGTKFGSSYNLKSYSSADAGTYGTNIHVDGGGGTHTQVLSNSITFSGAVSYSPTGISNWGSASTTTINTTVTYSSKFELEFGDNNYTEDKIIYDYNSNGTKWYVSEDR